MTQAISKKVEQAKLTMPGEEISKLEEKEVGELASRYGERIGKVRLILHYD